MFPLLSLLLAGCVNSASPPPDPKVELRTYAVDGGIAHEAVSLLNAVLDTERVRLGPDGRIVVIAEVSIHEGIEELLVQFADGAPPSPRVRMQYWLVMGEPADETQLSAAVESLRPVLEEVAAAQTPMRFSLVERVSVRAESGEYVEAEGLRVELWQTASVRGDAVVADLNIQPAGGAKVQTRVQLRAGQTLVLGETGVDPTVWGGAPAGEPERPAMLYYVVRPTVEGASGAP